jgi:hypothetical protein
MPYTNNLLNSILPELRIMFQFYGPGGSVQPGIGWYIIIALVFASAFMITRKRK